MAMFGLGGLTADIHDVEHVVVRATMNETKLMFQKSTKFEFTASGKRMTITVHPRFEINSCGVPGFFWEALGQPVSDCRVILIASLLNALYTIKCFDTRIENDVVVWNFMKDLGIGWSGRFQFFTGLRMFGAKGFEADRSDEAKLIVLRESLNRE